MKAARNSSIRLLALAMVAVVAANEMASAALLFYLLVYTLMNIGAFAIVISVAHQGGAAGKRIYVAKAA